MKDEKKNGAPSGAEETAEAIEAPQTGAENAESAAGEPHEAAPDASVSRTGYADRGSRPGEECVCPDGRKGTVHRFDAGLICIPNHDQG